ncbi:MAG: hypothetical protein K0Q93_49 [Nocardioidaceae bacterium]|nr:hypothetical protein [Nocardioidaceae bacterium]
MVRASSRRRLAMSVALPVAVAVGACGLATGAAPASGQFAGAHAAAAERPTLSLRAAADKVVGERYGSATYVDLGTHLVAGEVPFEVRTTRHPSYRRPVEAVLVVGEADSASNGETDDVPLAPSMVDSFRGMQDFVRLRVRNSDGRKLVDSTRNYCVPGKGVRTEPGAPDTSPYPEFLGCPSHPFTLGSVMGIQAGWGSPVLGPYGIRLRVPLGRYAVTVAVTKPYRALLGMSRATAVQTLRLRVVPGDEECREGLGRGCRVQETAERPAPAYRPDGREPASDVAAPDGTPLPDLRSLPSTGISVRGGHYLAFGATVWNAGPSPLVVDGFRRADEDVMDSYQYFYGIDGEPAGHARVGTMVWDPRQGHVHWHFKDFARYRLLDAGGSAVVRSKKEAFCLAATDAVDYTVPGANWEPWNTDLETACGGSGSLAVREVLDAGSGDTYGQYRPGQSFNLDGLPDGRYFISVEANPRHSLHEADLTNNDALRRVRIGTAPDGDRTVRVFDVGLVHTR